jgi:two-component system OmpR family sensor kinase
MPGDPREWPLRKYWIDLAWGVFAALNLAAMLVFPEWETVPFHFIWVSVTLLYGFRVWKVRSTLWTLAAVIIGTGAFIGIDIARGDQPVDEITEVPLMAAMFLAMVWHARRRLAASEEIKRVSETNLRLLERQRRFVQDASHELRTPITVALGHTELIQRTTADQLVLEDASVVADELQRLRRLAERLLLLASAEHPDFLRAKPVELEPLMVDIIHRWFPTPRHWALGRVADDLTVEADPDRLALALDALIENAVKHTKPEDSIELAVRRDGATAVVSVSDSGPGIPQGDLERIFDRFARVDTDRNREGGGMGLGLPIVKAIAEAHGGSVRVRSEPGRGSTFELLLPASPSSSRPEPLPRAEGSEPADALQPS